MKIGARRRLARTRAVVAGGAVPAGNVLFGSVATRHRWWQSNIDLITPPARSAAQPKMTPAGESRGAGSPPPFDLRCVATAVGCLGHPGPIM